MRENEFETSIPLEQSVPNTPDMAEIAPDTTPTPVESTREAVPMVKSAAPNAATLATVAAMVRAAGPSPSTPPRTKCVPAAW